MASLLYELNAAGVTLEALPRGGLRASGPLTDKVRTTIRTHKADILAEMRASNDPAQPRESIATREQAAEIRTLVALIVAAGSDADRAEALEIALADPESALMSFRALAADRGHGASEIDDRRPCIACSNLSPKGRCLAAWRGEKIAGAGRQYSPEPYVARRCECFTALAGDPDQRTGAERWPSLVTSPPTVQ